MGTFDSSGTLLGKVLAVSTIGFSQVEESLDGLLI